MRSIILAVSAGLALVPALATAAPLGTAHLSVGPNINVSHMPGNQAETTVAVNPTNPNNVVIVSNVQFGNRLFEGFTLDGVHWTSRQIADGTDSLGFACCDPSAAFDEFGNLFLTYLDSKAHDVQVALSTDGGASFRFLKTVEQANTQGNPEANKWGAPVDQPTLTTGHGSVWVTWKIFSSTKPVQASGAPVLGLGQVGDFIAPEDAPGSKAGSFGDIAIGPTGQVMITYQDNIPSQGPSNIFVNVDPDGLGAVGFGPAIKVDVTNVGGFDFITPQASRSVDAETGLAYDRSGGPHNGRVYLVVTDEFPDESNNTDLYVRFSDDGGQTWSPRVKVNDDRTVNAQFNPRMSLDETTGNLAVSFYDSRNDLGRGGPGDTDGIPNDDAQFFAAASTDGGVSFSRNVQVSAGTSNAADAHNGVEFGDYSGMAFTHGVFYPAWADNSNSTVDNPDGTLAKLDVYTAKITVS
ncbi:MAG: exo-alpha-sialidase [Chloroflexi bacterium]|nr:MAG: exo-alpha-sialidase [Chloroflexota bacterium]